jgi:hypothetical protein
MILDNKLVMQQVNPRHVSYYLLNILLQTTDNTSSSDFELSFVH